MKFILIALGIFFILRYFLYQILDKKESELYNRTSTISNQNQNLLPNQKYAIVGLLAYIQGASSISAYDTEANNIVKSIIFNLGLSKSEVERYLQSSFFQNSEHSLYRIVDSLKEIRDRDFLKEIYNKALKIARISGDIDTIETTKKIFKELGLEDSDTF